MSDNVSNDKEYLQCCTSFLNSFRSISYVSMELNEMKISTSQQEVFDAVDKLINQLLRMEDDFKLNSKAELVQSLKNLKATVPTAMVLHEQMSKKADELTMKCDQWIEKMIKDGTKDISTSEFKSFLQILEEISEVCEPYSKCIKQLQNQLTEVKYILDKFFAEMQQELKKKEEEFKKKKAEAYRKIADEKKRLEDRRNMIWAFAIGFGVLFAACTGLGLIAAGGAAALVGGAIERAANNTPSEADIMSEVIDKANSEYNAAVKTMQQQIDRHEMQIEGFRCHFNELKELLDKCEANSQFNETTQKIMHSVINEIKHEIQRREEEQRKEEENRALKEKNRLKDEEILRLKAELAAKQQ